LPKAELVRRLIRASIPLGPASRVKHRRRGGLGGQLRRVGRNLAQVLKAIHRSRAVRIEDTEPIGRGLYEAVSALGGELTEMTVAYGSKVRRNAGRAPRLLGAEE
jgi:hypothetical protein